MFNSWKTDLQSSLVVFLVALPLCLGIALASNAPMMSGIYAGVIGGIIIGFFSDSSLSVSGPAAGLTVIVASALATLNSFEAFTTAVLMSGIFQIIFSLLKGGRIGDFFPTSVVKGMLAAIGILLIMKQIPHSVGYDAAFMVDEDSLKGHGKNAFDGLLQTVELVHPGAVIVTLFSFGIMLSWERLASKGLKFFQLIPGALVAVLFSVLLNYGFDFFSSNLIIQNNHLVSLPLLDGITGFFSNVRLPLLVHLSNPQIYITAFTIAVVGSLESLLSVDAIDKLDPHNKNTDKNRELLAQGIGNTLSGIVGGLPITAVIVRSSANQNSGAKSKLSAILHGVWLLVCVVFIPDLLNKIPLATLASILLLVGYKLTKPKLITSMYSKGKSQFIPFAVTIVAILLTNLLMGIFIGILAAFFFVIRSNLRKSIQLVDEKNRVIIKFSKDASFLHKVELQEQLNLITSGSTVVFECPPTLLIDIDIQEIIEDFVLKGRSTNINVDCVNSSSPLCSLFSGK